MIPIRPAQQQALRLPNANFSLAFGRMTPWNQADHAVKHPDDAIQTLRGLPAASLNASASILTAIHTRQHAILESALGQSAFALEIEARLTSPFVSGLGSEHPTETGMILDRNTGVPYLPASSIKGVLRLACALVRAQEPGVTLLHGTYELVGKEKKFLENSAGTELALSDRDPVLRAYFGDTETDRKDGVRGQLVFLDAFPKTAPKLKLDIMNPHYPTYYQDAGGGRRGPVEDENPIPVKFIAVESGAVFVFRAYVSPLPGPSKSNDFVQCEFTQKDRDRIIAMFEKAFTLLGFGGKTAIGYGRFSNAAPVFVVPRAPTGTSPSVKAGAQPAGTAPGTPGTDTATKVPDGGGTQAEPATQAMPKELSDQKCTLRENSGTNKKPKWKAVCVDFPGCSGSVINSAKIPESCKVGSEITLLVKVVNGTQSQFTYSG